MRRPWLFHVSTMTVYSLSIWCVGRELIDVVDSIRHLSFSIHWRFQGLQWLCFSWRFMEQPWHSILDNSMCQPWLYFCYRFDASVMNSLTLWIPHVTCHLVFRDDFLVYSESAFAHDLWINSDITFFTIPCVSHESILPIDLMCRSWIHLHCRFHT
jgi:hypothetical protein